MNDAPSRDAEIRERMKFEHLEVDHHAQPWRAEAVESGKAAVAFAQSIIKTSQLLNGGGLLAIPALVTLFSLDVNIGKNLLIYTGASFCLGLMCAWICNYFAYYSQDFRSRAAREEAHAAEAQIRHNHRRAFDDPIKSPHSASYSANSRRLYRWSDRAVVGGVILSLLSLVCFLFGAYFGYRTVTETPQRALMSNPSVIGFPSPVPLPNGNQTIP
ncbi:MAG: hypothetical protein ING82_15335 [Roseomonas sp.]|nr:hypothetical protein [Roseomonas sp.]